MDNKWETKKRMQLAIMLIICICTHGFLVVKYMMSSYTNNQYNHLPTNKTSHMRSLDPKKWDSCCISGASVLWSITLTIFFQVSLSLLPRINRGHNTILAMCPNIDQDPQGFLCLFFAFEVLSTPLSILI